VNRSHGTAAIRNPELRGFSFELGTVPALTIVASDVGLSMVIASLRGPQMSYVGDY
jgi:hypothetical protein